MKCLWEKEYILRVSDFDKYNRIKPSAILEIFQDAAGQHAEEIGAGSEAMMECSGIWVLTRVRFKIISNPKSYQRVIVRTWPLAPNRLIYRREFCIESEEGEQLIAGSSEWVVMHREKRRLLSVPDLYSFDGGFYEKMMFEEKLDKIRSFENADEPHIVHAGFSELDVNNHVNNTKYANYTMDAINPSKEDILETFQIDYRKEVLEGTKLYIYQTREQNEIIVKGLNDNGDIMFACRLEYK